METRELVAGGPGIGESVPSPRFRADGRSIIFGWTPDGCSCGEIREVFHGGGTWYHLYKSASARFEQLFNVSSRELKVLVRETRGGADELGVIACRVARYEPRCRTRSIWGPRRSRPTVGSSSTTAPPLRATVPTIFISSTRTAKRASHCWPKPLTIRRRFGSRTDAQCCFQAIVPVRQVSGGWTCGRDGQSIHRFWFSATWAGSHRSISPSGARSVTWRSPLLDIELVGFDGDRNVVGSPRQRPVRVVGANASPDWSADGASLIYVSERKVQGVSRSTLVIHALATGEEREMHVPVNGPLEPAWSPVGRTIVVRGPGSTDGRRGARLVDSASGQITQVFPFPGVLSFQWTRDGAAFFFTSPSAIQRADVATGRISPITLSRAAGQPDGLRCRQTIVSSLPQPAAVTGGECSRFPPQAVPRECFGNRAVIRSRPRPSGIGHQRGMHFWSPAVQQSDASWSRSRWRTVLCTPPGSCAQASPGSPSVRPAVSWPTASD